MVRATPIVLEPPDELIQDPQDEREEGRIAPPHDDMSSIEPPESPALSEISATSATSSSRSWHLATSSSMKLSQVDTHAIHAVLELSQGGCLPGDRVPVQISIRHVKPIKNMNGIIVTLFRTCRVDTHPDLPLGPVKKGSTLEYEDYYPKSKTGLGGLSLSSAGSHKTFRQDLNQVFEPLIIDPKSLTAQIKTHVKIPDDVFPSITSVPGSMISFKYEVEVLVDLRGRMAGQDYIRSQMGMISIPQGHGLGDPKKHGVDGSTGLVFPLASGFGCLDTSQMRREKFVISRAFEVVVGTHDSERMRLRKLGKHAALGPTLSTAATPALERQPPLSVATDGPVQASRVCSPLAEQHEYSPGFGIFTTASIQDHPRPPDSTTGETFDDGLDEKTRLRNAEARLLPSAPPTDDSLSSSEMPHLEPTAPPASEYLNYQQFESLHPFTSTSDHSLATIVPTYSSGASDRPSSIEDNERLMPLDPVGGEEELAYQRLQQQASSPDNDVEVSSFASRNLEPSAPPVDDMSSLDGCSISNIVEDSRASEGHLAGVVNVRVDSRQALEATQPGDNLEPPAPLSSSDDNLYEAHPTHVPLEGEHLPVYQK